MFYRLEKKLKKPRGGGGGETNPHPRLYVRGLINNRQKLVRDVACPTAKGRLFQRTAWLL